MFQIQKLSKICISSLGVLILCRPTFAQTKNADFTSYRANAIKYYGCDVKGSPTECQQIRTAESFPALFEASQQINASKEKAYQDRLLVLECCLGISTDKTCDLPKEKRQDLDSCKETLSKRKKDS